MKAVFFDFDETLAYAEPPVFDTFLAACDQLGIHFDQDHIRHGQRFLYRYFTGSQPQGDYAHFGADPDRFYVHVTTRLLVEMGLNGRAAETAAQVEAVSVKLPRGQRCPPETEQVLKTLQERGYALGVISNNGEDIAARCRAFGLDRYLSVVINRLEAGCAKPDPRIFRLALDRVGLAPQETAYVGDNYYADILGAQALGMAPVLLDPQALFPEAQVPVIERLGQVLECL